LPRDWYRQPFRSVIRVIEGSTVLLAAAAGKSFDWDG
jgi:hypothetical protein